MSSSELTLANPVFKSFVFYGSVLLAKTALMSLVTAYHRITKRIFATEEDVAYFNVQKKGVVLNNSSVERVRRAHQNDLENIIPFVLLGFFYVITGPGLSIAVLHFRIFTAARILHTLVYLLQVPQPARALTFFIGMGINLSLVFHVIKAVAF